MKPDLRRADIARRVADHILAHGLEASSLRPLAKAAGTSDRMLLYYFKDKAELTTAALSLIMTDLVAILDACMLKTARPLDELRPALLKTILAEDLWPYLRVWLEIASLAAKGDSFFHAAGHQIASGFLAWGAAQLASDTPETDAAKLLVSLEGAVLLKSVGLDDIIARAT
jgi:AcrR family transcriptional regulator